MIQLYRAKSISRCSLIYSLLCQYSTCPYSVRIMANRSEVWKYFGEPDHGKAMCKLCRKKLACAGSSTSGLRRHLETSHKLIPSNSVPVLVTVPNQIPASEPENVQPTTKQPLILDFLARAPIEEHVARLIALNGIAARTVARSEFIRQSFGRLNLKLPKCERAVMNLMHKFFEQAKRETIKELNALKGNKLSSTLDEWTSFRNRRYLNVNMHSEHGQCFNLGLIRIPGSCPAEEIERLFWIKVNEFELSEKDVIGCTSDGARVMIKFGRMLDALHQQCLNHGIHLGVIDVIVEKKSDKVACVDADAENYDDDESFDYDEPTNDEYNDSEESEDESDDDDGDIIIRPFIHSALAKVRNIVCMYRRSPVKNALLQQYIKEIHGKELMLILDCRTRWNSVETMLTRFLRVYDSVKAASIELNLKEYLMDDDEIILLNDLLKCLEPIKMAVLELSKRDCNLLKSEGKGYKIPICSASIVHFVHISCFYFIQASRNSY